MFFKLNLIKYFLPLLACTCLTGVSAVTMQQFETSLEMMRNGCAPKFKIPVELLDRLRGGDFVENNAELKCYTKCVAQLAGTVTKKGDFSVQKALAQIPIILPPEIQDTAKAALNACKDVQKSYKDSCERVFYTTKCVRDYDPDTFKFP
ncbi:general odorant-binding protein lush [Anastrepha obliqua]|uniref:general odorant-binding protein lush n=1 Tax=Anastrepha ludens TaxID=28586 RepID=UPI0023AF86AE|nr:general odorant-binding protein lush [Anastrepha ludens]XP_054734908.1 general odorant-binding protein lush [Anastrepha obliqua]XP_054734910.1 general odorant-binding protein lush [Anastrepha obliqua]